MTHHKYFLVTSAEKRVRQVLKPYKIEMGVILHGAKEFLIHGHVKAYHDNPTSGGHFGHDKSQNVTI